MNKALAEQHNKEVGENRKVWNQNKGSVFGQILLYLSQNARQTIQEVEHWEQIEEDQNPVTLWRIIEETFGGDEQEQEDLLSTYLSQIETFKQAPDEPYQDYIGRFDTLAEEANYIQTVDDKLLFTVFIRGIDRSRYG